MKLSVLSNLFSDKSLDETLEYFKSLGVESVEIGVGGYPGKAHANPEVLLSDENEFKKFTDTFKKYGIYPCVLSVHGNPVHPQKDIAKSYDDDFRAAVLLAEKMGIDTIVTFSGCPGDSENSKYPNWVTCPWPEDYLSVLDWQWNEVLIPYWKEATAFAKSHGVTRIALEMHPGFCVYNPETLLKLRSAVGDVIGANFDPSHLIWQGIDVVAAVRALTGAIYHVHAKDTKIDRFNSAKNGVLDTKHYSDEIHRSWVFRTIGYGNNETFFREFISELVLAGYDRAVSIEHEDSFMTPREGLEKAVSFIKPIIISEDKPKTISWA